MKVAEALLVRGQDAVSLGLRAGVLRLPELAQLLWLEEHVPALQLYAHRPLQNSWLREQFQGNALPVPRCNALRQFTCIGN